VVCVGVPASGSPPDESRSGGRGRVELRKIGDFDSPTYVASAPGFDNLLFVVERAGRIVVLRDGRRAGEFLDIADLVSTGGERGLLSVAFPPDYETSRRLYVYYTDRNGAIEVDHFRRSPDSPVEALPDSREQIITIPHPGASNHNGGTLAFGPDGKLYLASGDGAVRPQNAQDRGSLLGKLLRIDPQPTSRRGYRTPRGNPYRRRGGQNEIFSVGLRNPFRFSFDRRKPILALADVGESRFEEVDYLRMGEARGANFGWPAFEGRARRSGGVSGNAHDRPMHVYSHSGGNCSITGGVTVRDGAMRSLRGRYIYADLCAGKLRSFRPRLRGNDSRDDRGLGLEVSDPVAFGEDRDGHVYVVSLDGPVYRLAPK
jgi:glucose/arabinose dehydrogenase